MRNLLRNLLENILMCRDRQQYMMEELNRLSRLETKRNEYNILMEKKLVSARNEIYDLKTKPDRYVSQKKSSGKHLYTEQPAQRQEENIETLQRSHKSSKQHVLI